MSAVTAKPFIVLTLRRTGGTSFAAFMSRISSYATVQHEPFNKDRVLGQITRDFHASGDQDAMARAIEAALAGKPNIKHCIEVVPPELTRALIDACLKAGYCFFVLTRRNEANRLMSLALALATGAWGSKAAADIYPKIASGEKKGKLPDLASLKRRALVDAAAFGDTLKLLRYRAVPYQWLVFEEIYADDAAIRSIGGEVAAALGEDASRFAPELAKLTIGEGQRSVSMSKFFKNYENLKAEITKICVS